MLPGIAGIGGFGGGAASPAWTPVEIVSNIIIWMDPESGVTESSGSVERWRTRTSGAWELQRSATGPTVAPTGINNETALNFSGSVYLHGPTTGLSHTGTAISVFFVATIANAGDAYGRIVSLGNNSIAGDHNNVAAISFSRNDTTSNFSVDRNSAGIGATMSYGTPFMTGVVIDGANGQHYLDGSANGSSWASTGSFDISRMAVRATATSSVGTLGAGYIGEIIVTSNALSTNDRQKLEGYLAHRYGTTASLPGGHPYKTTPPTV